MDAEIFSEAHPTESEGGSELDERNSPLRGSEFVDGEAKTLSIISSLSSLELMVRLRSHANVVFVECQPRLNCWKNLGIHTLLLKEERLEMYSCFP